MSILLQIQSYKDPNKEDRYYVEGWQTIGELREMIAENENMEKSKVMLYLNNELLDSESTISQLGLVTGVYIRNNPKAPESISKYAVLEIPEGAVDGNNNG